MALDDVAPRAGATAFLLGFGFEQLRSIVKPNSTLEPRDKFSPRQALALSPGPSLSRCIMNVHNDAMAVSGSLMSARRSQRTDKEGVLLTERWVMRRG